MSAPALREEPEARRGGSGREEAGAGGEDSGPADEETSVAAEIRLRDLRWWDVADLVPLEHALFPGAAWSPELFWSELAHPESRRYLVAEDAAGQLLGYAGLLVALPDAEVQTIGVAPVARGRGLGGRLLRALLAEAVRRGATSMLLEVRADNEPAIALYRRHGFERISVRRRYYQPDGMDAWIMRLRPIRVAGTPDA